MRSSKIFPAALAGLAFLLLTIYYPGFGLNFYGDDYSFLETAGRMPLGDYFRFYFDPVAQTGWYRPLQGMLFGIEWLVFGSNPVGYHAVLIIFHLCNTVLLSAIAWRLTRSVRISFGGALIWSGLPLYSVAVFWPADADFELTFFYLLAVLFWIKFLQTDVNRWQILAFAAFLIALTTKEFGVTIPFTLFLLDRFVVRKKDLSPVWTVVLRYAPFLFVFSVYAPLELYIQSRSVLTNVYGYGIAPHLIGNFKGYLAALAFPWILPAPLNEIWLFLLAILIIFYSILRKTLAPFALVAIAVMAFAPAALFPWFFYRYLYTAVIISSMFIAVLCNFMIRHFAIWWVAGVAAVGVALLTFGNGLGVASAAADFAEISRQTRVPFRDFNQRHATLPPDTYVYFVQPPTITSQLSGMLFLRYGSSVHVAGDEWAIRANLRDHKNAYVIYFDEESRTHEIAVDQKLEAKSNLPMPVEFGAARLAGWELASDRAFRGEAIALILYWDAPVDARIELVNATTRQAVAGNSRISRGATADARVLKIPANAGLGSYQLEISSPGVSQSLVIAPIEIGQ